MNEKEKNLVWIDLEFTGLNFEKDQILEIATIITDPELNILATGPNIAIATEPSVLKSMDEWNTQHHGESGLIQKCLDSDISMEEAQKRTIDFLQEWTVAGENPLCGNSVCADRRMLYRGMPELEQYLNYRNINVTTVKKLVHAWYPEIPELEKKETHTALLDIEESIEELKYYRKHIFK